MFKKECIHCIPDESCLGKHVIYGDTWTEIKSQVESNNWTSCRQPLISINYESSCPFTIDLDDITLGPYKFIYYDPEWDIDTQYRIIQPDKELVNEKHNLYNDGFKDGVNTVLDKFKEMRLKEVESQFIKILDGLSSWKTDSKEKT